MSLDVSKLADVSERTGKTIARCPACAEADHDQTSEHLFICDDGRFGCVVYPGDGPEAKQHRRRIFELCGSREIKPLNVHRRRTPGTARKHVGEPRAKSILKRLRTRFAEHIGTFNTPKPIRPVRPTDTTDAYRPIKGRYVTPSRKADNPNVPLKKRLYVLRTQEGEYVERIDSGEWETVKLHFVFTRKREHAAQFTYDDLWSPYDTTSPGMAFTCGFAGGTAERIR